jgi:hypothetical protein
MTAPKNTFTSKSFAAVMARVPEKELKLITLARELVDEKGNIDAVKAVSRAPEINLARAEAQVYANATVNAINALKRIKPRGGKA